MKDQKNSNEKKSEIDAKLMKDLESINIDALTKKTAVNRSIWKKEIFDKFGTTEKSARRKLRSLQLNYSKSILRELKLNNKDIALQNAKQLKSFYTANLVDIANYSNVSEVNSPEKFKIIHTAYKAMKSLIS